MSEHQGTPRALMPVERLLVSSLAAVLLARRSSAFDGLERRVAATIDLIEAMSIEDQLYIKDGPIAPLVGTAEHYVRLRRQPPPRDGNEVDRTLTRLRGLLAVYFIERSEMAAPVAQRLVPVRVD